MLTGASSGIGKALAENFAKDGYHLVCTSVCNSSSVGAPTSTKLGTPSASHRYAPSSTRQCRWMLRLAADPKRLGKHAAFSD